MNPSFLKSLERECSKLSSVQGSNYRAIQVQELHGPSERYFAGNIKGVKFERHKRTIVARKFDRPVRVV